MSIEVSKSLSGVNIILNKFYKIFHTFYEKFMWFARDLLQEYLSGYNLHPTSNYNTSYT